MDGRLEQAGLGAVPAMAAKGVRGTLSGSLSLTGQGRSLHAAAARSSGYVTLRLDQGLMPRAAALLIGGDLLRAVGSLGGARRPIAVTCAAGRFVASDGRYATDNLVIQTPAGLTAGHGSIELASETLSMTLTGQPTKRRLFQVAVPISLSGPLLRPIVSLSPGRNARKLGLNGKLGILLSPIAAALPLGINISLRAKCS